METTTFEQDPAAAGAAAAARARWEPVVAAAAAEAPAPASAAGVHAGAASAEGERVAGTPADAERASTVLDRATGTAQLVAHYDPDPGIVGGTLLYALLAAGALTEARALPVATPEEAAFAKALLRLGQFDVSAQWQAPGTDVALSGTQTEGLRKMLLAVVDDPRLVLARVAEQLWALRGAKHLPESERRRLALQAREVYGPLANRLGLAHLKWELEDHAFRHLQPDDYKRIATSLNERRADRERYIAELRAQLTAELAKAGVNADVQGRPKHIYSIWRKMTRKHLAFEQVFDVRAVRVLVDTVPECYAALGVVHGLWPYVPGEFDDYVATPKPNGYRSIHTAVIGPGEKPVEVQIRTREMHERAELGVAAHWRYKEGGKRDAGFERKLERLRELLAPRAGAEPEGLIDRLGASLFADHVYVVSPKGDVVELPAGATPLDFAYHVHTSLGHRCRGAKVDGRMVALDYRLKNGETVEIITAREPQPSRDWLVESRGFLASKSARAKVRTFFRKEDEDDHRQAGLAILERELDRLGAGPGGRSVLPLPDLLAELKFDHADELYVALGAGDLSPTQLANAVTRRLRAAAEPAVPPTATTTAFGHAAPEDTSATGMHVMGIRDVMSSYAQCCRPVPPEPVAGYVTVGRGVTIHRADCANLKRLQARQPDRIVDVGWGLDAKQLYGVEITVQAYDRRGLLRDITGVLADAKLSIDRMSTVTNHAENVADMTLAVRVHDLPELDLVLTRIRQLPDVLVARRR